MTNSQIAEVFQNIAGLLDMKGESSFTVRAYQRAARTIERLPTELEQMVREERDLKELPGVGEAISAKIEELVDTGELRYFDNLRSQFPEGILDLMRVPGLGPKTTMRVWKELGVTTLVELERAIRDGSMARLPRMGAKATDNILRHIMFARGSAGRTPIARAMPAAQRVIAALRERCPSIARLSAAGSLRRFEETVGDIDLACAAGDPREVLDALAALPGVAEFLAHGDTKASAMLSEGVQVDLRVVEEKRFGALLQYLTGNQQHNILLRERANRLGLSLNEHGLTDTATGKLAEFAEERDLYARLGLQYVPPEIRQGLGEVDAALGNAIPAMVEEEDIRGDLHVHTDWSDGRDSVEQMLAAAAERGLRYVAVTDHSVGRGIANGLGPERLRNQVDRLRQLDGAFGGLKVLCGTEMDIRADGSLDYADDILAGLDWVIASVHSAMAQGPGQMTERITRAMRNPHVTVIGHLTTRLIGERQPIDADFEAVFKAAADTGTALEINASPERLDLKDLHVQRARELGVPLVISTDAHTAEGLDNVRYGAAVARRGWCGPRHILNTWPAGDFLEFLKLDKPQRTRFFAEHGQQT